MHQRFARGAFFLKSTKFYCGGGGGGNPQKNSRHCAIRAVIESLVGWLVVEKRGLHYLILIV